MSETDRADELPYFWRATDQMEVDYLEVCGSKIKAFEFKRILEHWKTTPVQKKKVPFGIYI